jgi:hypothetical protein
MKLTFCIGVAEVVGTVKEPAVAFGITAQPPGGIGAQGLERTRGDERNGETATRALHKTGAVLHDVVAGGNSVLNSSAHALRHSHKASGKQLWPIPVTSCSSRTMTATLS